MLINQAAVKEYILSTWKAKRPGHEITRVSQEALSRIDRLLAEKIDYLISTHPSVGKTFRP